MDKIVILSRVSTGIQDLEQQTNALINHAHNLGYTDTQIIIIQNKESAIKLSEEQRQGLSELKDVILTEPVKLVLIYELSRLSRRPEVLYSIRNFLVEHGVNLICMNPSFSLLDQNGQMDSSANVVFSLFTSLAENEMYIKKQRFKRGKAAAAEKNTFYGGSIPYGYTYAPKTNIISIVEKEAEVVRRVYEEYNQGMTLRDIAKRLIADGSYPSDKLNVVSSMVRTMLHREIYTGRKTVNSNGRRQTRKYAMCFPPIISEELFDSTQELLGERKIMKQHVKHEYVARGIIFLDNGQEMHPFSSRKCYTAVKDTPDGQVSINLKTDLVDRAIWRCIDTMGMLDENVESARNRLADEIVLSCKEEDRLSEQVSRRKEQILRIERRVIEGKLTDDDAELLERDIRRDMADLDGQLRKQKERTTLLSQRMNDLIGGVQQGKVDFSTEDKARIVRRYVEKVVVSKSVHAQKAKIQIVFLDGKTKTYEFKTHRSKLHTMTDTETGKDITI